MYLMYIDESGDTIPLSQKGKSFLALAGCVIHEEEKVKIEETFRLIKQKYYQTPDIEIKSNFLRYANPDLKETSPIKLKDRQKYNELEKEVADFLKSMPVCLFSVVINKPKFWEEYPAQNPYDTAYILLMESFQKYLEQKQAYGIAIIDPREGQVEKAFINNQLDNIHNNLRWSDGSLWQKCPNIIERILFATSDKTIGIQLADLFCYPIFHIFEYNKRSDEYWRFSEITLPKLKGTTGNLVDLALKFFPEASKKDLRFYA